MRQSHLVTAEVARRVAEFVAALRSEGRRAPVSEAPIAATAIAHDLVLDTQDTDFGIPGLRSVAV